MLSRRSVRNFLDKPVPASTIRRVLQDALRAPSGGNLQPWHLHVVGGEKITELKALMRERVQAAPDGEGSEYDIYPRELVAPYRDRAFATGGAIYGLLGIPREDRVPASNGWRATAHRRRSAGLPVPIAEVHIVDAEGVPVPRGTVGEIAARGPMVMAGYWNKPEQTADVLRDGWMHTGDGGYMDPDGFVYMSIG